MDLRDPTDPGHIIVPANGRNMAHALDEDALIDTSSEEAVRVSAEPAAHEVGQELQDAVAYRADDNIAAEPADTPREEISRHDALQSAPRARRDTSIHGPSLLGLSDDDLTDTNSDGDTGPSDYSYLYEDEGSRRGVNWRLMLALIILIGFGGVLAYMWSQGKNWNTTIIKGITGGDQKKEAPVVAKTEPTTPGAPEIAVGQTQKPIPADTPQSDKDANSTSANKPSDAANAPSDQQSAKSADKTPPTDNTKAADSKTSSGGADSGGTTDAAAVAAKDKSTKDANAKDKNATGAADNLNSKQAKATTPDIGDEEDAEPPATAKSAKATRGKASAAKSSSTDDEVDDAALVHRADALLRSRNCNEAVDLFREAALHGNATARSRLGGLYATGHCVPLDRAEAYNWFTLAKDAGAHYSWIDHNRNMLWAQMTDRERERVMRR
jgi:hypothetical protein